MDANPKKEKCKSRSSHHQEIKVFQLNRGKGEIILYLVFKLWDIGYPLNLFPFMIVALNHVRFVRKLLRLWCLCVLNYCVNIYENSHNHVLNWNGGCCLNVHMCMWLIDEWLYIIDDICVGIASFSMWKLLYICMYQIMSFGQSDWEKLEFGYGLVEKLHKMHSVSDDVSHLSDGLSVIVTKKMTSLA